MSVGCSVASSFAHLLMLLLLTSRTTALALKLPGSKNNLLRSSSPFLRRAASSSSSSSTSTNMSTAAAGGSDLKSDLINCPTIPLRDGTKHPAIGFGTYKVGFVPASASAAVAAAGAGAGSKTDPDRVERTAEECVSDALDVGYRFLECAQFYGNEEQVGKAIERSGIDRADLFICSKVWTTTIEHGPAAVRAQLDQTLKDLKTDYVDLYLIHWPVPGHHVEAYKTLVELKAEGKIRGIGVSNYAWEDYLELKDDASIGSADLPLVNQIEINPFLYRKNTIALFQGEGVVLQSYRSLRDGKAFDHPLVVDLAAKHGRTPAQVLGRWCVQRGFVYVPKSVRRERMVENARAFDFVLSESEMADLDALTTADALTAFRDLYRKCVNRDTTMDGTMEGVKMDITLD